MQSSEPWTFSGLLREDFICNLAIFGRFPELWAMLHDTHSGIRKETVLIVRMTIFDGVFSREDCEDCKPILSAMLG
jgi:hypothetical protein